MARALVIASIKAENPDLDEADVRARVFARFYANEFAPAELASIIERLREAAGHPTGPSRPNAAFPPSTPRPRSRLHTPFKNGAPLESNPAASKPMPSTPGRD